MAQRVGLDTDGNCPTRLLLDTSSACSGSAPMGSGMSGNEDLVVRGTCRVFSIKFYPVSSYMKGFRLRVYDLKSSGVHILNLRVYGHKWYSHKFKDGQCIYSNQNDIFIKKKKITYFHLRVGPVKVKRR